MPNQFVEIFACPDCHSGISLITHNDSVIGLFCENCKVVFSVKDGIFILLPSQARNYELELPLLEEIRSIAIKSANRSLLSYVENTIKLVSSMRNKKGWEWEDESFWSKKYSRLYKDDIDVNWNLRLWQREFLLKQLLSRVENLNKKIR